VYEGKEMGLVVDYIGIKNNMNIALKKYGVVDGENFDGTDKAIIIVKDQLDLLARLLHKFDSTAYFKGTPLQQLTCLNQAAEFAQQTDEVEKRFMAIVKKLHSAYNLCCTSEDISENERDYIHFYLAVKSIIHKLTVGAAPDASQMNEKVRCMIQEALISEGVEEIFTLDKNDPKNNADLFSDEYMAKIDKIKLPNTKIKLLQKLLSMAIDEFRKTNRIQGVDFSKRLKKLIELYNERKDFQTMQSDILDDVAEQFTDLFAELVKERNSFKDLGIDFEEKAFYDILKAIAEKHKFEYPHDKLIKLSQEIKIIIDDKARYTDWSHRDDIKAELKVDLILTLAENGYPPVPKDEIFKEIFEQAENFKKYN
jgi:type I restriction enzyme R subunit